MLKIYLHPRIKFSKKLNYEEVHETLFSSTVPNNEINVEIVWFRMKFAIIFVFVCFIAVSLLTENTFTAYKNLPICSKISINCF